MKTLLILSPFVALISLISLYKMKHTFYKDQKHTIYKDQEVQTEKILSVRFAEDKSIQTDKEEKVVKIVQTEISGKDIEDLSEIKQLIENQGEELKHILKTHKDEMSEMFNDLNEEMSFISKINWWKNTLSPIDKGKSNLDTLKTSPNFISNNEEIRSNKTFKLDSLENNIASSSKLQVDPNNLPLPLSVESSKDSNFSPHSSSADSSIDPTILSLPSSVESSIDPTILPLPPSVESSIDSKTIPLPSVEPSIDPLKEILLNLYNMI